jgi:hypothetical protein
MRLELDTRNAQIEELTAARFDLDAQLQVANKELQHYQKFDGIVKYSYEYTYSSLLI